MEYVAWANQFNANSPPAGTTVYRTDNELASPVFYTQSAGQVSYSNSIQHWERPVITDYDRRKLLDIAAMKLRFIQEMFSLELQKIRLAKLKNI